MTQTVPPDARFLRAAQLCRMRDLERLSVLGELVHSLSELIHALQIENPPPSKKNRMSTPPLFLCVAS